MNYESSEPTSLEAYVAYYRNQIGHGYVHPDITTFKGSTYQRGNGVGSIFSWLGRTLTPLFSSPVVKNIAGRVGKRLLASGVDLGGDILAGQNVGAAFKQRAKETGNVLIDDVVEALRQKGSGIKRRARKRKASAITAQGQKRRRVKRKATKKKKSTNRKPKKTIKRRKKPAAGSKKKKKRATTTKRRRLDILDY